MAKFSFEVSTRDFVVAMRALCKFTSKNLFEKEEDTATVEFSVISTPSWAMLSVRCSIKDAYFSKDIPICHVEGDGKWILNAQKWGYDETQGLADYLESVHKEYVRVKGRKNGSLHISPVKGYTLYNVLK